MASSYATGPFQIRQIPGNGLGMVATSAIQKNDVFMSEDPLVLIDDQLLDGKPEPADVLEAFGDLSVPDQNRVQTLFVTDTQWQDTRYKIGPDADDASVSVQAKFYYNLYGFERRYWMVGETLARLNHSCVPNATARYDSESERLELVAIDDIPVGREVSIPYVVLSRPRRIRMEMLADRGFEFSCECEACVLHAQDPSYQSASEGRRARMHELERASIGLREEASSLSSEQRKNGLTENFARHEGVLKEFLRLLELEPTMWGDKLMVLDKLRELYETNGHLQAALDIVRDYVPLATIYLGETDGKTSTMRQEKTRLELEIESAPRTPPLGPSSRNGALRERLAALSPSQPG